MGYVLFDRREGGTPHVLKRYETHKGALIGLRASNRNAGWVRVSRCGGGIGQQEWCYKWFSGWAIYDYAPYMIALEQHFDARYRLERAT